MLNAFLRSAVASRTSRGETRRINAAHRDLELSSLPSLRTTNLQFHTLWFFDRYKIVYSPLEQFIYTIVEIVYIRRGLIMDVRKTCRPGTSADVKKEQKRLFFLLFFSNRFVSCALFLIVKHSTKIFVLECWCS